MTFKAAFVAHAPDADPGKHKSRVETSKYELSVRLVKDQSQAIEVCKKLVKEGIHSILLCPGFTHEDVSEISEAVGDHVGVFVARGDGPSSQVTEEVMRREGWFSERERD